MTPRWKIGRADGALTALAALAAVAALSMMTACAPAPAPTPLPPPDTRAVDEKAIRDSEIAWVNDMATHDVERVLPHYTDDATVMGAGFPVMKGKDAIREGLKGLIADPKASMTFTSVTVEVARSGDLGYSRGTYELTAPDPKTKKPASERGSFVTVYRKQAGGSWKAVQDIITPDATSAPAVPGAPSGANNTATVAAKAKRKAVAAAAKAKKKADAAEARNKADAAAAEARSRADAAAAAESRKKADAAAAAEAKVRADAAAAAEAKRRADAAADIERSRVPAVADLEAVTKTLQQYADGYKNRDASKITAVYPSFLAAGFSALNLKLQSRDYRIDVSSGGIQFTDKTRTVARVAAIVTSSQVGIDKKDTLAPATFPLTFTLAKQNGAWVIKDRK